MPSDLARTDLVLLNYLCKKTNAKDESMVSTEETLKDFDEIQREEGITVYQINRDNGKIKSPDMLEDLAHLSGADMIRLENGEGIQKIGPHGLGNLSGRSVQLPNSFEKNMENVINRETSRNNPLQNNR